MDCSLHINTHTHITHIHSSAIPLPLHPLAQHHTPRTTPTPLLIQLVLVLKLSPRRPRRTVDGHPPIVLNTPFFFLFLPPILSLHARTHNNTFVSLAQTVLLQDRCFTHTTSDRPASDRPPKAHVFSTSLTTRPLSSSVYHRAAARRLHPLLLLPCSCTVSPPTQLVQQISLYAGSVRCECENE